MPSVTFAPTARTKVRNTATVDPQVLVTSNGNQFCARARGDEQATEERYGPGPGTAGVRGAGCWGAGYRL
ncbi:hypothetical protein B0H10DRAFT_2225960 [Mycena sp. CBHHK59/15]|nr:hypothetical protein B0H10DRAFT_2225960 [Mycena sp. CBHHK59/15]